MATYDKCGSNDRLCEDKGDTCVRVGEMSAKHVYVVRTTHSHKYFSLKQNKPPFAWQATTPIPKDDTFYVKIKHEWLLIVNCLKYFLSKVAIVLNIKICLKIKWPFS